jgi:Tol biopolymer transport system component
MNNPRLISILVVLFVAGCTPLPTTIHPVASLTPSLQNTTLPITTLNPEFTPTTTSGSKFVRQCLQLADQETALKGVMSGTILYYHVPPNERFILKDVQTGIEYELPKSKSSSWADYPQISPNGKMLALMEWVYNDQNIEINNTLWIFDVRANLLGKISFDRSGLSKVRWLDNERLIVETETYGTLLIVNPFTGEKRTISNELPGLDVQSGQGASAWRVEYSSDLEWAAYLYITDEGDGSRAIMVRDVVKNQDIWHSTGGDGGKPVWSPDGHEVAVVSIGDGQLYLVNRSGQVTPVLSSGPPHKASSPSWSPNGRFIVFWNADSLVVYDRRLNQMIDLCIPGYGSPIPPPVNWSPDSQQFIVYGYSTHPILVNWEEKVAYKIQGTTDNAILGWMNSLP